MVCLYLSGQSYNKLTYKFDDVSDYETTEVVGNLKMYESYMISN
jgi:hypothetical protein